MRAIFCQGHAHIFATYCRPKGKNLITIFFFIFMHQYFFFFNRYSSSYPSELDKAVGKCKCHSKFQSSIFTGIKNRCPHLCR